MKRMFAFTLCTVIFLLLLSGCNSSKENNPLKTDVPTNALIEDDLDNTKKPEQLDLDKSISLFSDNVLNDLPKAISKESREKLLQELNVVFSEKNYGEEAEIQIRSAMEKAMDYYVNFQTLFAFFDVPDCATYLRNYFLNPLKTMVNNVVIDESAGEGMADDYNKILTISKSLNPDMDAAVVIHELWHMSVAAEHGIVDSKLYFQLNEGGASFSQLILSGSKFYDRIQWLQMGGVGVHNPENTEHTLWVGRFGTFQYSQYFAIWYRLFTLTDFDTMALFLKPNGAQLIRQEMVKRYGENGSRLFDLLELYAQNKHPDGNFACVVEFESLYLQLLKGRLQEVESPHEMLAFLHMYRITRLALGSEYLRSYVVETEETGSAGYNETITHPDIDYVATDKAVAEAVYNWHIINRGKLTDKQEYALAYCISAFPANQGEVEHRLTREAVQNETLLCSDFKYYYKETGENIIHFYFDTSIAYRVLRIYNYSTGECINFER